MRIQFASPQTEFKCEHNQCALNSVLVSNVKWQNERTLEWNMEWKMLEKH